ncbi:Beta-lactamase hydrolase-like protein [Luteitalea pratensis]|uniref:Beta-lactamase hydrolase-like protein n=1 Tax=Luteitalea pratensis TaxID=1855912 RepID=A0A143PVM3_LUTPR|nr:Beta-lactamase hydrolase-like protein [Luteitalea pratensis]
MPPFEKNGYVVASSATGDAIVIDPGDEVEQLIAIVRRMGVTVRYIMLTHSHLDHISGCNEAKAEWAVPLVLHKDDLFLYERAVQQGIAFGIGMHPQPPIDAWFDQQPQWAFGDCVVIVHHTPGHSPGQVCLQIGEGGQPADVLFVGDTLFAGSIGRTDLPGGDHETLLRSVRDLLFPLGDHCTVYPGHGPATTIGEERRTNPFLASIR